MSDQSSYIDVPFVVDADDIAEDSYDYLQTQVPGWEPNEGNLERIEIDNNARTGADIMTQLSAIPKSIFRYIGKLVDLLPVDATPANVQTTWTMIDNLGHTIPGGTTVSLNDGDGNPVYFTTLQDVVVPAGSSATGAGEVTVQAVDAGLSGSGLGTVGGLVTLEDPLDFIETNGVVQTAVTTGGQDAESDDSYLSRLSDHLRLLTRGLVLGRDYEAETRSYLPGVRATAINGYDPDTDTDGNERTVGEAVIDATGEPLSAPAKADLLSHLSSFREVNFLIKLFDPTYTLVDVTYDIQLLPGFDATSMQPVIDAVIAGYLSPADWGIPEDRSTNPTRSNWVNVDFVSYFEIVTLISNIIGVDRLYDLQIGAHGDPLGRIDLTLDGKVPLPRPGTIGGTIHNP